MIRVAVISENRALREKVCEIFTDPDYEIVTQWVNFRETLKVAANSGTDLYVVDLERIRPEDLRELSALLRHAGAQAILITSSVNRLPPGFTNGVHIANIEANLLGTAKRIRDQELAKLDIPVSRCCE